MVASIAKFFERDFGKGQGRDELCAMARSATTMRVRAHSLVHQRKLEVKVHKFPTRLLFTAV